MEDDRRYTLQAKVAAERLQVSRQELINMGNSGELAFRVRKRGAQPWRYYDPEEIRRIARERGIQPA